jgi:chitosanase
MNIIQDMKNAVGVFILMVILNGTALAGNQNTINDAIQSAKPGDTVILENGTYVIDGAINMKTGVNLAGSGNTIIKASSFELFKDTPNGMIVFSGVSNSGISTLTVDGGETANQYTNSGHGWENGILIKDNSANIVIRNIRFSGLCGDGINGDPSGSSNVLVKNCVMKTVGHDGVQCWDGDNWQVINCTMDLYINSGVRYANSKNCIVKNCYFYCDTGSGYAGIELEDSVQNITITENTFSHIHSSKGIGIVSVHATGTAIIEDNIFEDCPGGNIVISGITVNGENSTSSVDRTKEIAFQLTSCLENSNTEMEYNYAENINDGRGVTFGAVGFCTGTYDGNILLKYYRVLNPNNTLAKYIPALDKIDAGEHNEAEGDGNPDTTGLDGFITDVQNCNDPLFKTAQLHEIDVLYWNPAINLSEKYNMTSPLSKAFIYDICIRHGTEDAESMLKQAKSNAVNMTEYAKLSALIKVRDNVLKNEGLGDVDRDTGYKALLESSNYYLITPFVFSAYGDKFTINVNEDSDDNESDENDTDKEDDNSCNSNKHSTNHNDSCNNNSTDTDKDDDMINNIADLWNKLIDMVTIASSESKEDMNLTVTVMDSSTADAVNAYNLSDGNAYEKAYSAELIKDSEKKQAMAEELFEMSKKHNEKIRELTRKNLNNTC